MSILIQTKHLYTLHTLTINKAASERDVDRIHGVWLARYKTGGKHFYRNLWNNEFASGKWQDRMM